jgi:electron transport complex protein RnfC
VLEASQHADVDLGERLGMDACIECGVCSYVCPSKLPLLTGIRSLKARAAAEAQRLAETTPPGSGTNGSV